jgi:hypothetical protein
MFDESKPKIFGLNTVDWDKPYKLVEGCLDSLFLENCIAMSGADGNMSSLKNVENASVCFDNEPRNSEIHKRMQKLINSGIQVCIWPKNMKGKDINEFVLNGHNSQEIENIIKKNLFKGLEAQLRFNNWKQR